ncbi:MAG TPA: peptidylprolyl isomerase [Vicinamibacteria bacterium]|nr:peptidylprolyl isomerase [Vicinamibacteria bacterium]
MKLEAGLAVSLAFTGLAFAQPTIAPLPETTLLSGSPLHVSLDGSDPSGTPLRYSVTTSDPALVEARILEGNRSLRIAVANFGTMLFELFDQRVPRVTNRIAELANSGFYDGVVFHRVIDGFVIQGGDPTGTGSGGSSLEAFADQFHVELQHNRTGLLSMAKAGDDTNDSQFFVTEGAQRHLDFNHSIFGVLVEGEDVRERISSVAVDSSDRPIEAVVMQQVRTTIDEENAVLMLKAPEGSTGAVDVTVTVVNDRRQESRVTFRINVIADTINSPPFLADIPELSTAVDTPVTYQLQAIDVEGDPANFLDQVGLNVNGLPIPVVAHPDLRYQVDFDTGLLTVTPTAGLSGRQFFTVATAVSVQAVDYQVVPVVIEP